ncbi:MAG TPA: ABC transporter permease [Actinomycetes bacterium]
MSGQAAPSQEALPRPRRQGAARRWPRALPAPLGPWLASPWRKPRFLEAFTLLYLAWSLLPVGVAALFSFNAGRSRSSWQGFSLRWYWQDQTLSVWHDPELHRALVHSLRLATVTTLIAVPIGVAFAIGVDRWRGRIARGASFQMLLSFVVPELVLGVALLFLVSNLFRFVHLGGGAQILGLVTFQLSYPAVIVRARLLSIGPEYEEAAMDLGASPAQATRRVLLPLLWPAVFASAVLVFADVIDDFVIVRYLSSDAATEPMSVKIYAGARGAPTPALNALATVMLVSSLLAVALGVLVYRRLTRGERGASAVADFASQL